MATETVTPEGQLTLPEEVRHARGVGPGDRVDFVRREDDTFAMLPATRPVMRLAGLIPKPRTAVPLDDMDEAIARGARDG